MLYNVEDYLRNKSWKPECVNMGWRILVFYPEPMEKSVIFTGACANEIIPSINRSFVYKAKEGGHVRMRAYIEMQKHNLMLRMDSIFKWCQSLPGYTYILLPFCYRQGTRLTISCFTVSVH